MMYLTPKLMFLYTGLSYHLETTAKKDYFTNSKYFKNWELNDSLELEEISSIYLKSLDP